ncbi:hypothetical protein BLNAU_12208 [Blattamonas nauphoetae]|uniref:Peptidase C1A papain C-terminal domain-containing protein n=1 Tax=Blattamonas nauphoetae TaxID=2049346 RepID=A0ABQ9XQH4_9EUKA|nr:hypothetical protein BLNAU_12208 [Blattamonas nauphoetae]
MHPLYPAWDWMVSDGAATEECIPYVSIYFPDTELKIMQEIYEFGPVQANMYTFQDFSTYKSGNYEHKTGKWLAGHAVVNLGWGKPLSIDSVLEELTRSGSDVSVIVNTRDWNQIPVLIREWDGKDEGTIMRLLDEMSRILTLASDSEVAMANKRLLHSSLSALSQNPTLPKKGRLRITQSLAALDSVPDGPFVLVETEEFRRMEQSHSEREQRSSKTHKNEREPESRITALQLELEEQKKETRDAEEAKKKAEKQRDREERGKVRVIDAMRSSRTDNDQLKLQLANLPIWIGADSLQTLDRTAQALTPTTLTQFIATSDDSPWRTSFTGPINEGEWELKIRASENTFLNVMLGFLQHPLPENATQNSCGAWKKGIGGDFILWNGKMWKAGEYEPEGTNKKCDRIGQTAAIRVNMWTREARLFVDDEEQPGIFTDIPSPLSLAITTGFTVDNLSVEVLWLKRLRGNEELEQAAFEERRSLKSENERLKQQLTDVPIWTGSSPLQTLDRTAQALTPTTLTQFIATSDDSPWRTSFTGPINEGEWELKIRASENTFLNVNLAFLRHPLPENATQHSCGYWLNGIGGDFYLWNGKMWKNGEFKPAGTNKKCDRIGQTAAIRVNMRTREARLFVDDEEQPGIFTDIPSPLCLGITTGFTVDNRSVEVLWLKRLRS